MPHASTTCAASEGKFRLLGTVAGIDACQLVSDIDHVTVGSGLDCDLVVTDPLVPRRAFRLLRQRDHYESEHDCRTYWLLETFPGARVYINNRLVRRGRVTVGDTIALGCHQFQFTIANPDGRNSGSNTEIDDLCERLLQSGQLPSGYLESCPSWANRRRTRVAVAWAVALAIIGTIGVLMTPHEEKFVQMQPPMEIVMTSENAPNAEPGQLPSQIQRKTSPNQKEVRSLATVQRKTIAQADEAAPATADIMPASADTVKTLETQPLDTAATTEAAKPMAAPQLDHPDLAAGPGLPSLPPAHDNQPAAEIAHMSAKLESTSPGPARRLSVEEAADPLMQKELREDGIKISSNSFASASSGGTAGGTTATPMNQWTAGGVTRAVNKPSQVKLDSNRSGQVAAMERYQASPLGFEKYQGVQIPVARLPGDLNLTGVDDERASLNGKPTGAIVLDGDVSESEMAVSWKSGQFHTHAAGSPPPVANPPTYCFVGKKQIDGKPFLYISYICKDPNLDDLNLHYNNGTPFLSRDDSIEIFLDTTRSRTHYYQMIVNARGDWWAAAVENHGGGKYDITTAWDAKPQLKTMINKQAGRWSCEILIPFDRVGGEPAAGSSWGVNFCRNFRGQGADDSHLQTWFSVFEKSRNFHNPELFGRFDW